MNTRSRIALSTVLGLSLVGLCLGSAQAQSGTKKAKVHHETQSDAMQEEFHNDMVAEPAPIGYPFAAPGGLHLYHWADYTHQHLATGSSYSAHEDNRFHEEKMMHDRMMHEDAMTDPNMVEPAPMRYPAGAPGGLNLYHYRTYAREEMVEGSASMTHRDHMEMRDKMVNDRIRDEDKRYGMAKQPAPIDYPFAAPGTLHLYHYTDYTHEGLSEGSAPMKQMDNEEKMEKERRARMKANQSPN
jgi:uncharacterized membrane-anchored protein YhcB (DUF1043 family)